jgi:murein DD-endopeptidase MepM/ murein hydrolase activator NlpD
MLKMAATIQEPTTYAMFTQISGYIKTVGISVNYKTQLKCDYKLMHVNASTQPAKRPIHHWLGLVSLICLITVAVFTFESDRAGANIPPPGKQSHITEELPLPEKTTTSAEADDRSLDSAVTAKVYDEKSIKVRAGDSLAKIFSRVNLSPAVVYAVMHSGGPAKQLRDIRPGQTLNLRIEKDSHQLSRLEYVQSRTRQLEITHTDDGYKASLHTQNIEIRHAYATGTINDSLFLAGRKAGLSDTMIMQLAGIFGWDIDFALDIREGDSFIVVYEEKYLHGEKVGDGNILAAEFINNHSQYRAFRYTSANGDSEYYSEDGKNMRKAFLRTPVQFSRISSRFTLHRKHPILNRIRAHKGVDYAAKRGTPIRATGNGKIIFRGRKGGYGNVIVIRHGSTYSTLYGHMDHFRRGLHTGSKVKQGQVIGYVGMTGLATGPHLHYEFRVHGVHRNPLTVKLPSARHLPKSLRPDFLQHTSQYVAQLDSLNRTLVALNQ